MIYVIIGISLLFGAIGFIVTENNAKYLLAGYNTLSEVEREKINIEDYILFFRRFHIFLGASLMAFGLILLFFATEIISGIFITVYPLLAYIFFIAASAKYYKGRATGNKIGIILLLMTLIFIVGLFVYGLKENHLIISSNKIELTGSYGEVMSLSEIQSIELVYQLPNIAKKTNGFAMGEVKKGYFKTEQGEVVKLILNSGNKPYILLTKTDGKKIYYSAKENSNEDLYQVIKKNFAQ